MYRVMYLPIQYHTAYFHQAKQSPLPYLFNLPLSLCPPVLANTDLFIFCRVLAFPESHINVIKQYITLADRLLSFRTWVYGLFISLPDLIAHSFLSLNNIPLHGCTTVCLSIDLLKDILGASSFGEYE